MTKTQRALLLSDNRVEDGVAPGRCYIVIGANYCWGKAFTRLQAWENANKPDEFILYDAPPCAYVDGMGSIVWYPHLYAPKTTLRHAPEAQFIDYEAREVGRVVKKKRK